MRLSCVAPLRGGRNDRNGWPNWPECAIGLYYLINRYYDPILGRFISKDPASDPEEADQGPAEMNPYAYAANNPVMATDPDGLRLLYYTSPMMRGEDVRWVQFRLMMAGLRDMLAPFGADGIFGYLTKSAVIRFQSNLGIVADGIVGPVTTDRLVNIWGDRYVALPPPGTGNWIAPPSNQQTTGGQAGNQGASSSQGTAQPRDITSEFYPKMKAKANEAKNIAVSRYYFGGINLGRLVQFAKLAKNINYREIYADSQGYIFQGSIFHGHDLGNLAYGYAGAAAHISQSLLISAGGAFQVYQDKSADLKYLATRFEHPDDAAMTRKGHTMYTDEHGRANFYFNESHVLRAVNHPFWPTIF